MSGRDRKRRIVHALQVHALNRPIKLAFDRGLAPPGYALLETTGARTGLPRRTPVGDGSVGDTFWIVAEHGHRSAYVRNLQADPRVRVGLAHRGHLRWRTGIAHVVPDDDPRARQRQLAARSWSRRLNAYAVRVMGTELLTVRIDLDPPASAAPRG